MVLRTRFDHDECPIARGLDAVGEWWSILILRDLSLGFARFDDLEASLGIAPNMLARRLKGLVAAGLVERRPYALRPPRHDYVLTARGRDFAPVLVALYAWSRRQSADPSGVAVEITDRATGRPVEPILVDRATGRELTPGTIRFVPGPGAGPKTRSRFEAIRAARRRSAEGAASRDPGGSAP